MRGGWWSKSGQVLALIAIAFAVLMGFLALALDVAQFLYARQQLQTAAGAIEMSYCGGVARCTTMQSAVKTAMNENGYASMSFATQCATVSGTGLEVVLNNGPCALGAADPNQSDIFVTTTWPGQTPDCSSSCSACSTTDKAGCLVNVQGSYTFNFMLPFLPKSALNFSGSAEKVIQQ